MKDGASFSAGGARVVDGGAMTLISVALPVVREADLLEGAAGCMLGQTAQDLELLIVCNGSDEKTVAVAEGIARRDRRVRVLRVAGAGLARALNVAFREARGELVARMDVDDWCPAERLERQVAFLGGRTELGGVGCWYEEVEGKKAPGQEVSKHQLKSVVRKPPTEPREVRWRLLMGNVFAHGSMMLRKSAVLGVGGYDETCARAQDYELWLRMTREWGLCAVPEVLYEHRLGTSGAYSGSELQARHAAEAMVGAWRELPRGDGVEAVLARGMGSGVGAALAELELGLEEGPTREGLMGWLWLKGMMPAMERRAVEVCRAARVREVARAVREAGGSEVWLWGAGAHCGVVMELLKASGLGVCGLVDDGLVARERFGFVVREPGTLAAGEHVVLASDAHEDALWEASSGARARGVRVWRLYAE